MRKVDDGEKKKRKRKENNVVSSDHYVIASSLPPKRLRPNDDCWNAACSCQMKILSRGAKINHMDKAIEAGLEKILANGRTSIKQEAKGKITRKLQEISQILWRLRKKEKKLENPETAKDQEFD